MAPSERAMVVSYRLSIVTVALSVTIQPQFAIECLRRSNQQGVCHFGPKFRGVPLVTDPSCWGCKERTSQAIDVKNVLEKIKNVKKRKKRGQNKKRLRTLNKKTLP